MKSDRSSEKGVSHIKQEAKTFGGGAGILPPVVLEGTQYGIVFLSGSSIKSFTPDTADTSVAGTLFLTSIQERNSRKAKKLIGKRLPSGGMCATLEHNVTQSNIYLSGKIR